MENKSLERAISSSVSNQKFSPTCWAHACARILARLIKMICVKYNRKTDARYGKYYNKSIDDYFNDVKDEICNYYYTEDCVKHPFVCFNNTKENGCKNKSNRRKKSASKNKEKGQSRVWTWEWSLPWSWGEKTDDEDSRDETGNLKENVSVALYSYIYKKLIKQFGCNGYWINQAVSYFTEILNTTEPSVADIANTLITLDWDTDIFYDTKAKSEKKDAPDPLADPYVKLISEKVYEILMFYRSLVDKEISINVWKRSEWGHDLPFFEHRFKESLDQGYYAGLSLIMYGRRFLGHALTIVGYEEDQKNEDFKLVIKNSWGENTIIPINFEFPEHGIYKLSYKETTDAKYFPDIAFVFPEEIPKQESPPRALLKRRGGKNIGGKNIGGKTIKKRNKRRSRSAS
jgi:hypothetical protein